MIALGRFGRVLKKDGTLLFKPYLRDTAFFSELTHLFHMEFGTKFRIASCIACAKGFHIRLKEAPTDREAAFLSGEEFGVPLSLISGKSTDILTGMQVFDRKGVFRGEITSFSPTPTYLLLTIKGPSGEFFVPFISDWAELVEDRIIIKGDPLED